MKIGDTDRLLEQSSRDFYFFMIISYISWYSDPVTYPIHYEKVEDCLTTFIRLYQI